MAKQSKSAEIGRAKGPLQKCREFLFGSKEAQDSNYQRPLNQVQLIAACFAALTLGYDFLFVRPIRLEAERVKEQRETDTGKLQVDLKDLVSRQTTNGDLLIRLLDKEPTEDLFNSQLQALKTAFHYLRLFSKSDAVKKQLQKKFDHCVVFGSLSYEEGEELLRILEREGEKEMQLTLALNQIAPEKRRVAEHDIEAIVFAGVPYMESSSINALDVKLRLGKLEKNDPNSYPPFEKCVFDLCCGRYDSFKQLISSPDSPLLSAETEVIRFARTGRAEPIKVSNFTLLMEIERDIARWRERNGATMTR